jgi:dipeptidyl aminopeptidase/acylaminoacyl peptidase
MTSTAPFGSWESPISAADTIAGVVGFTEPWVDGDSLYWLEIRPEEGGRQVLVTRDAAGAIRDLTPAPTNVRTRVHEYGGGAYAVHGGTVVYADFSNQRLYLLREGVDAVPITPEPPQPMSLRYADMEFVSADEIVCVRESHPADGGEAVNDLVAIPLDGSGSIRVIASGRDFYSSARVSPDGATLAWLEWDHPNMPWDGTELKAMPLDGGEEPVSVAGSSTLAIAEPVWSPDGDLYFISEAGGWWNPHRWDGSRTSRILEAEIEFANPAWVFRYTSYGALSDGRLLAAYWDRGRHVLALIERNGVADELDLGYSRYADLVTDGQGKAWAVVYHAREPSALVEIDIDTGTASEVRANPAGIPAGYRPVPELIAFPTANGDEAHGVYYPPTNPDFSAPEGEAPPLIVRVHGGPTSNAYPRLSSAYVYWTSRGFGLVDVNYRGSTGYGRAFRKRLEYEWGVADVDDCTAAAAYLASTGRADPDRLVITGGSAGGYTTLAALAFRDGFSGGASYYGVADVGLLAKHTHKFESRYLDRLVREEDWAARSPINGVDGISAPVILFQGLDDRVVPPEQARMIAEALAANGVAHALIEYEGEDHGFRKAESIINSLETELAFYGKVLGFKPAGDLPALELS